MLNRADVEKKIEVIEVQTQNLVPAWVFEELSKEHYF